MKQVFVIHGGDSFNTYNSYIENLKQSPVDLDRFLYHSRWSLQGISTALRDFVVYAPAMPNKQNAQYDEWSIVFEKLLPYFTNNTHLVGHSLGATFLAKFLHERTLPVMVAKTVLVAAAYNDETTEDLGGFRLDSAANMPASTNEIHLFHSTDDFVVPFSELARFQADLPQAKSYIFSDRGHFLQPDFPELYKLLEDS